MTWNPDRGSNKDEARRIAFGEPPFQPKRRFLTLPGAQLRCVRLATTLGVIDQNTHLVLVEGHQQTARLVREQVKKRPHTTLLQKNLFATTQHDLGKGIDGAYLDLCGNLCDKGQQWFSNTFLPCTADKADISLTFCLQERGNTFVRQSAERFAADYPGQYRETKGNYYDITGQTWMAELMCGQMYAVYQALHANGMNWYSATCLVYMDELGSGWMAVYRFSIERALPFLPVPQERTMNTPTHQLFAPPTKAKKASTTRRTNSQHKGQLRHGKIPTQVLPAFKAKAIKTKNRTPTENYAKTLTANYVEAINPAERKRIASEMREHANKQKNPTMSMAGFKARITLLGDMFDD